jgi:hypothetical protein
MVVEAPVRFLSARRVAIAAATAFLAINLWTGAPLLALWVGSKVVGQRSLSMAAVFVVLVVLGVLVFALALALAWLDAAYNRLTGVPLRESRLTWLRSMNTQGETVSGDRAITALERIVMASVYLAVVAFVVWFFVFARSPLPG